MDLDSILTQLPPSCPPVVPVCADCADVDQICISVWKYQETADVVKLLFNLLDFCVLGGDAGWRPGGPGELRFRVDPL